MEYIAELVFWVVIGVVVGFLGSSRREEKKVDANKTVMRQMPSIRYGMYTIGILIGGMFAVFGAMALRDGAQKEEPWLVPLTFVGLMVGALCCAGGYIFYAKHVFFDEEELIVGRPFRSMLHVKWQEISRMETKKTRLLLYGADGKKLVAANPALENFDLFSDMAKRMCSAKVQRKGNGWENGERVMERRMAFKAMLAFAALLFFLFTVTVFVGGYGFAEVFTRGDLFFLPLLFAAGAAALFYAIFLRVEKIRYTKEEITFCSLFGKKKFSWRDLRKIRREEQATTSAQKLYLTWEGKERVVSSTKYPEEYKEFLDFIIEVALERNVPTQNL